MISPFITKVIISNLVIGAIIVTLITVEGHDEI